MTLVDELLKGVDDETDLSEELANTPGIQKLLDGYQCYRKKFDIGLPNINETSTGREFKDALLKLPPQYRVRILNEFNDQLTNPTPTTIDPNQDNDEKEMKKLTRQLINFIVYGFFVLAIITIVTIASLSILGKEIPTHEIFSSIFGTITEIFKVIAGF